MGIVVQALVVVDELALAERIADAALELSRRRGALLGYSLASFHRAILRYQRGALRDALADIEQALTARSEGWDAGRPGSTPSTRTSISRWAIRPRPAPR